LKNAQGTLLVDEEQRALLADFGISSMLEATNQSESLDSVPKSWRWTAPEVINDGGSETTTASDVYAFASVCYEVCFFLLLTNMCRLIVRPS
jgi:serine/threonine protein kinase